MLPASSKQDLIVHLKNTKRIHEKDLREGAGRAKLPDAIALKYPNADSHWGWQFVFPASSKYFDRNAGMKRRHHVDESMIQKAIKEAVQTAGITKHGTAQPFATVSRRSFWKMVTISARFKNFSGITMFAQLKSTPTFSIAVDWAS
jgi:hypothetical protein